MHLELFNQWVGGVKDNESDIISVSCFHFLDGVLPNVPLFPDHLHHKQANCSVGGGRGIRKIKHLHLKLV